MTRRAAPPTPAPSAVRPPHRPVLLREVLQTLAPRDGGLYVDGTFGAGGYSQALLEAADCTVWGIDRDPDAVRDGEALAARYPDRLRLVAGRFGDMVALLAERGVEATDGIALDLGVSSMQIDRSERGFSFRADGPLDMRMEQRGPSAADVVNAMAERALADLIHELGEERRARQIARAIVAARKKTEITRTLQLADIVRRAQGPQRGKRDGAGIDPATRTFQALRIHVNDELGELDRGLVAAETLLRSGGRFAVVSFHSLEDRRVKAFLRQRSGAGPAGSRHAPPPAGTSRASTFRILPESGLTPSDEEVRANPRARSARLRAAERTAAPAWPHGPASAAQP